MRIYEELFIVQPEVGEPEQDALIEQITQVISSAGGTIDKTEKWGRRKLAYRVQKRNEGIYVLIQFRSGPDTVHEIERRLRVSDLVMKFITVRIDEKLKRLEKIKKGREKRAARKPVAPAAAPAMPSPEQIMAEAKEQ
jgi:small subunit ribosomal protein S6